MAAVSDDLYQPKWIFHFSFLYPGGVTKDALFNHLPTYVLKNDTQNATLAIISFSPPLSSSSSSRFLLSMAATNILIPVIGLVSAYLYFTRKPGSGLPTPPGPKPLPFLGHIFNLPTKQLWLRVTDWSKIYGEPSALLGFPFGPSDTLGVGKIIYAHVFGQGLVFLNTAEACSDLLEKRGTIYSDKPHLVMCGELYVPPDHPLPLVHISIFIQVWM